MPVKTASESTLSVGDSDMAQRGASYARSLIEASLDPLVTISPEGKITDVNQATEQATGLPRDSLIGTDFADYFTEPEKARTGYREVLSQGQVIDYPLALRHISGKITEVLYNASVYRDKKGEVLGVFAAARDITARKRAEEALRASEERYRGFLERNAAGVLRSTPGGRILLCNDALVNMLGYGSREELLAVQARDLYLNPGDRDTLLAVLEQGRFVKNYELWFKRKDGSPLSVLASVTSIQEPGGPVVEDTIIDITERKRAEDEARRAAGYARSLIEASLDPLVTISPEGKITDVNQATEVATGVNRANLLGTDFAGYFTEPGKARAGYREVLEKGQVIDYPLALRHVSGKVTEVLYNGSLYRDDRGGVVGVFAAARDVTERKRAGEALRLSEERFRSLVVATTQIVFTADAQGRVVEDLPTWRVFTGRQREELEGAGWLNTLHPEDRTRAAAVWAEAIANRKVYETEFRLARRDGQYRHMSVRGAPVLEPGGGVREWVGTCTDITDRKLAEAELAEHRQHLEELVASRTVELQASNQMLATTNKELETFAYSVSHDLRTPLRAVDGFSRILLEEYSAKLDTEGQRLLHVVRESTKKMAQLIEDILAFSRLGRQEIFWGPVDMNELVRNARQELEPALAGRNIQWDIQPLPAARGDARMLQRVWTNLLDNAVKFTRLKPDAVIQAGAQAGEKETVYFVKDNGVGFDMQYANKLFGVFQRLHGEDQFAGTGIGLAIAQRVVTRQGGRIWAEGQVGQGATFYFALPRTEVNHARSEQPQQPDR